MNNKGFAISAVLYTLLIAFLLFLGVTLAVFKSSARTIGNANNDIIDGKELRVSLVESIYDYSSKKYGGCDDWLDSSTCKSFSVYSAGKDEFIKNFECVNDNTKISEKTPKKHYWYEYTKCGLGADGKFNGFNESYTNGGCDVELNQTLIKIDSIKGPMFWPRDFSVNLNVIDYLVQVTGTSESYKGVSVECSTDGLNYDGVYCTNNTIYDSDTPPSRSINNYYIRVCLNDDCDNTTYIGGTDTNGDGKNDAIKLFDFCAP